VLDVTARIMDKSHVQRLLELGAGLYRRNATQLNSAQPNWQLRWVKLRRILRCDELTTTYTTADDCLRLPVGASWRFYTFLDMFRPRYHGSRNPVGITPANQHEIGHVTSQFVYCWYLMVWSLCACSSFTTYVVWDRGSRFNVYIILLDALTVLENCDH